MDAGGSKFALLNIAGRDGGTICVVGDGRGNQEHTCHNLPYLQRAGAIGQFSSRPKQYPIWGHRSTAAGSGIMRREGESVK